MIAVPASAEDILPAALVERGPDAPEFDEFLARVLLHREYLKTQSDNEALRQRLSDFTIEAAGRIERLETRDGKRGALPYAGLVEQYLPDTLWRVGYRGRHGEPAAQFALGTIYRWGLVEEADAELSCRSYAAAASVGHRDARYRHAMCLAGGSEIDAARGVIRQAAEAGHPAAQELLGRLCLEAEPRDGLCAQDFLARAAQRGRVGALSLLAWMHAEGEGVPVNATRARRLYADAAQQGDLFAMNNLGELFETGRGGSVDTLRAVELYQQAAEGGFAPAALNLARCFSQGIGTAPNLAAAEHWARLAAEHGAPGAGNVVSRVRQTFGKRFGYLR